MTPTELDEILSKLHLQTLSNEELQKVHALLSLKLSEASWILNCRKHHQTHFPSKEKK